MMPLAIAANAVIDRAAAAMATRKAADSQHVDLVTADADPLLTLIRQYRAGVAAFDAGPADLNGIIAAATYEPFLSALEMPPAPTTLNGAMAGLDFVREELAQFSPSPACRAVLAASMDFMRKFPSMASIGWKRATYYISAHTDIISGTAYNVEYARECLLCEPVRDLSDGLVVMALAGGHPHLARMQRNGRDADGRFVKPGSENEAIDLGFFRCRPESIGKDVLLLGRLVDQTRRFRKGDV